MKRIIFIFLTFLISSLSYGQDSLLQKNQWRISYLKDSCENRIGYMCSISAMCSYNIYLLEDILADKHYFLISHLLDSENPSTQYLAVETIFMLKKRGLIGIDSIMNQKIEKIKLSNASIPFCSGCTIRETHKVKELLRPKNKLYFSKLTKKWIKDMLK